MHPSNNLQRIVDGKRYSVATATLIASNEYWDGSNWERNGRNCHLYRTVNGAYFVVNTSQWQGESETLTPISADEAVELYEGALSDHDVEYEDAFPHVQVEEA